MQRRDARMLLIPYRNECATQPVLRGRQALAGQPLPDGLQRRGFQPYDRQCLLQFRWQLRAMQAPQHLPSRFHCVRLNAASNPDWPSTYGNRVNCNPQRCTDAPPVNAGHGATISSIPSVPRIQCRLSHTAGATW